MNLMMSGMDISKQLKQLNEATIKGDTETAQKITQEINEQAKNIKPENLAALIAQSKNNPELLKNNPELLKDNPELLKAINNGPLANNMGTLTTALTNPNSSQFNKLTNKQALVNAKMSAKEQAKFDQQIKRMDEIFSQGNNSTDRLRKQWALFRQEALEAMSLFNNSCRFPFDSSCCGSTIAVKSFSGLANDGAFSFLPER